MLFLIFLLLQIYSPPLLESDKLLKAFEAEENFLDLFEGPLIKGSKRRSRLKQQRGQRGLKETEEREKKKSCFLVLKEINKNVI